MNPESSTQTSKVHFLQNPKFRREDWVRKCVDWYLFQYSDISKNSLTEYMNRNCQFRLQIGPKESLGRRHQRSYRCSAGSIGEQRSDPWGLATKKWSQLERDATYVAKLNAKLPRVQMDPNESLEHAMNIQIPRKPLLAGTISGTGGWRKPNLVRERRAPNIEFLSNHIPYISMPYTSVACQCAQRQIKAVVDSNHHCICPKGLSHWDTASKASSTSDQWPPEQLFCFASLERFGLGVEEGAHHTASESTNSFTAEVPGQPKGTTKAQPRRYIVEVAHGDIARNEEATMDEDQDWPLSLKTFASEAVPHPAHYISTSWTSNCL